MCLLSFACRVIFLRKSSLMHSLGSPEVSGGQGKSPKSWFASPEGCVRIRGWTPIRPHAPRVHCDPGQMMSLSQVCFHICKMGTVPVCEDCCGFRVVIPCWENCDVDSQRLELAMAVEFWGVKETKPHQPFYWPLS